MTVLDMHVRSAATAQHSINQAQHAAAHHAALQWNRELAAIVVLYRYANQ